MCQKGNGRRAQNVVVQAWIEEGGNVSESDEVVAIMAFIFIFFLPLQTLLPAASLLQLNGVRDACCKFLLSQLDPSNCLGIRGFADTHSCSDLLKSAHKYVLQHFVDVSKTEEFMLLPLKQVEMQTPFSQELCGFTELWGGFVSKAHPANTLTSTKLLSVLGPVSFAQFK